MATATILETYPDIGAATLKVGSDNFVHLTDVWGETWCASSYSTYYIEDLGEELETMEAVDDDKITSLCPGCTEAAEDV